MKSWKVKIDMSGQSNDCLRVYNVKMKKNFTGAEMGHISKNVWATGLQHQPIWINFFKNVEI